MVGPQAGATDENEDGKMNEIKAVGPERDFADGGARKIFPDQFPAGRPRQEQSEPERHERETKAARKIIIVAKLEMAVLDFPERQIHPEKQN